MKRFYRKWSKWTLQITDIIEPILKKTEEEVFLIINKRQMSNTWKNEISTIQRNLWTQMQLKKESKRANSSNVSDTSWLGSEFELLALSWDRLSAGKPTKSCPSFCLLASGSSAFGMPPSCICRQHSSNNKRKQSKRYNFSPENPLPKILWNKVIRHKTRNWHYLQGQLEFLNLQGWNSRHLFLECTLAAK